MVLTPEKAIVSFRLAGIGSRLFAHILDLIILSVILMFVAMFFAFTFTWISPEGTFGLINLLMLLIGFLYFIISESAWNGQTPGKKIMGIKVVSIDGTPATFAQISYRNLLRPADLFPGMYLAGFIAMFLNERSQRIGDLAASTIVIHIPAPQRNFVPTPHRAGIHPFEEAVGTLDRMTMDEYAAVKRFADRFPELPPTVQMRSVAEIWDPFAEKHGIDPVENVHPVYLAEAVVMKFGRQKKLF